MILCARRCNSRACIKASFGCFSYGRRIVVGGGGTMVLLLMIVGASLCWRCGLNTVVAGSDTTVLLPTRLAGGVASRVLRPEGSVHGTDGGAGGGGGGGGGDSGDGDGGTGRRPALHVEAAGAGIKQTEYVFGGRGLIGSSAAQGLNAISSSRLAHPVLPGTQGVLSTGTDGASGGWDRSRVLSRA
ncbi:uncharacterized protein LY79DRAFT_570227 [Colletotrichum navitas]|uniref:Uncharacterized protein n=1 Tax=Colletotrichum navitas TaxID=681940 RepID=A0AAD8PMS2_9PEZI|nr:uncharacterized protein LY79DRAFT_570227 [Colletotrichum navitas]KAK1570205.1 hypothetical protein LY79DRAFT_570227 [Colletotrichum navitas]